MKQEYDFSGAERGKFRASGPLQLPAPPNDNEWTGPDGPLGCFVRTETSKTLDAYRAQPHLVTEHANQERHIAHGHAHRQVYELVKNSTEALSQVPTGQSVLLRLTERFLYCADDGKPIDERGVKCLMFAHASSMRGGTEVGRPGIGFISVLSLTDRLEFFSRSCSVRFDRNRAAGRIGRVAPRAEHYPALPLPESISPHGEESADDDLCELMSWATNIVRAPLKDNALEDLAMQIDEFSPDFLLFVPRIRYLTLECADGRSRVFTLHREGEDRQLDIAEEPS